jgi:hypothetical protein
MGSWDDIKAFHSVALKELLMYFFLFLIHKMAMQHGMTGIIFLGSRRDLVVDCYIKERDHAHMKSV